MPLSVYDPIVASDILQIRNLKEGKIFMLIGRNGDKLVIKGEPSVTGTSIKNAASTVRAIDPAIKMKPLTDSEIRELAKFAVEGIFYINHLNEILDNTDKPMRDAEKKDFHELAMSINLYGKVVNGRSGIAKMQAMNMSTLKIAESLHMKQDDDQCWDQARETFTKFIKALNKTGGLEKLGEILAGDAFIGNKDRFNLDTVTGKNLRGKKGSPMQLRGAAAGTKLKIICNVGNIILVKEKKGAPTRPSMLDYMDPFSQFMKVTSLQEAENSGKWPMRKLLDASTRAEIARYVVDDLEYILNPSPTKSKQKIGGSKAAGRVEKGIVNGIHKITKTLEARQKSLPPVIKDYLAVLQADRSGRLQQALSMAGFA